MKIKKKYVYFKVLTAAFCAAMALSLVQSPANSAPAYEVQAAVFRVSTSGSDVTDCGSVEKPCRSIQYAVNKAATGDKILVAAGTYKYNSANDVCTVLYTRAAVCIKNKQLTILGGYSESNWVDPNPSVNLTVIDGEVTYRGVAVIRTTLTSSLTMQGFTIQNGRAVGQPVGNTYNGHGFGAGMYAVNTFVNLKDMVFKNNIVKGGSNTAYAQAGWAFGGGLALEGPPVGGNSTIESTSFIGNQAVGGSGSDGGGNALGGGLMASSTGLTATNLTFSNNIAKGGNTTGNACSAPPGGFGGAISLQYSTAYKLSKLTATNNQAVGGNASGSSSCGGPGIGGVFFLETATVDLSDAVLQANQALGGTGKNGGIAWAGGLYTEKVNLNLNRVKFIANSTLSGSTTGGGLAGASGGGGAYLSAFDSLDYTSNLTNCLFAENVAARATVGSGVSGGGGGLFIQAIKANITHSTFANNQLKNGLTFGQGILVIALNGTSGKSGVANLKYSAITDHINTYTYNNAALTVFDGNYASLSYSWFGNNTRHYTLPSGTPTNNIWCTTQSGGYISPGAPNYDYHLSSKSPLADIGVGSTTPVDLDNLSRPVNAISDLGAYEFRVPTLMADTPIYYLTDSNDLITASTYVDVNTGLIIDWTATTNASWIYLGPTGTYHEAVGQTGEELIVRLDPSKVSYGTHQATIVINSPAADPAVVEVYLVKLVELQRVYLSIVLK